MRFKWQGNNLVSVVVQPDIVSLRIFVHSKRAFGGSILLATVASLPSVLLGATEQPNPAKRPDAVVNSLSKACSFAFGGVGFVLAISQSEKDYRAILSRDSAEADFERVFAVGNPQAKCYALVGLQQTNRKRFEVLANALESSRTPVPLSRGCVTLDFPMSEIVKRIRRGIYSGPFTRDLVPAPGPYFETDFHLSATPLEEEGWMEFVRGLFSRRVF